MRETNIPKEWSVILVCGVLSLISGPSKKYGLWNVATAAQHPRQALFRPSPEQCRCLTNIFLVYQKMLKDKNRSTFL
jgi:hypothetical protein